MQVTIHHRKPAGGFLLHPSAFIRFSLVVSIETVGHRLRWE